MVPGIRLLRTYRRQWLSRDLIAGVVLTGLLAPAGLAYASASGMPPVAGLYASILPLLIYAMFGPSRIMVLGPDSSLTPLIAAAVIPLVATDPAQAVAVGSMLAVMTGVFCVVGSLLKFGFIAELLSAPVRYGYLHGIAITIIVGQAAKLCGFSVPGESIVGQLQDFWHGLAAGLFNGYAFTVGVGCLVVILVLKSVSRRIPGTLIAVVAGIIVTLVFELEQHGVPLVGDLPRGIPTPSWPHLGWSTTRTLTGAAIGLALVSFADTSVLSRTMAIRRREAVDANDELRALGLANIGSGLFHGFPISASNSRTPVAEASGAQTQLTGVVAALTMLLLAVAFPSVFRHLPEATLAAIVIAAAISLIDIPTMVRLYHARRSEFWLAMVGMISVAVLGPITGVGVAIALSLLNFIRLAWKPHITELVRVDGLKGYHDRERHPEGHTIPGLLLYRFDAPLFFANARLFVDDLNRRISARADPIRRVIVTAEPITDIDATAAEELRDLLVQLRDRGVELRFAELKGTVHDRVDRYGVNLGEMPEHTARTTGQAIKAYVKEFDIPWVDWEDQPPNAAQ
jgi:high affinity sulfate transporter 1